MSVPLPVIAEAYRALESQAMCNWIPQIHAREAIRDCIHNAQFYAAQTSANVSTSIGSGTAIPLDISVVLREGKVLPTWYEASFHVAGGGKDWDNTIAVGIGNVTNDVFFRTAFENIQKCSLLIEGGSNSAEWQTASDSTVPVQGPHVTGSPEGASALEALEERHRWLRAVYILVKRGESRKAMRLIFAAVEDYLEKGDVRSLGDVLSNVDLSLLDPHTMAALLRISGRAKRAMPAWGALLDKVRLELIRRGVPEPNSVLVGLRA